MTGITAVELMRRLEADPAFVARRDQKERDRLQTEAGYKAAESPLIDALGAAGVRVATVWDLVITAADYSDVLPLLLEHLELPYPAPVREGIARALAVPESSQVWCRLARSFTTESDPRVRDGLAVALAVAVDATTRDELVRIALDPRYGSSRVLLLQSILRMVSPNRAAELISRFSSDPELRQEVQRLDGRYRPNVDCSGP